MNQIDVHISPAAPTDGRILVVDDDDKSQRLLCDLLEAQGYSVMIAEDGKQALEKAFANPPDLILLDVMMPKMDGYEVCRHLRLDPLLAEVAIIMVTSLDDRAARLRGLDSGADDYITKPVDMIELRTRVRNVLQLNRYRKLLQERAKAQRAQAEITARCLTSAPLKTAAVSADEPRPPRPLLQRFSLASTGAKTQFAVAMALIAVIPLLVVSYFCLTGWLGFQATLTQLWPVALMVFPFMALGYWMLAKYPINVIRLRHYMESLTQGVLPDQVALLTDEDDLAAIELLMRKVVKQTETRVRTIESQSEALLEAERQRVMIQSLGTACHHLGQPATVISLYLEMTRRMALPAEAQAMLAECRVAADAVANILDRLQRLTVYRTEPYLSQTESTPNSPNSAQLIKI